MEHPQNPQLSTNDYRQKQEVVVACGFLFYWYNFIIETQPSS